MEVILVPGCWLDGSLWEKIVPTPEEDLDDEGRRAFRERAIPSPAQAILRSLSPAAPGAPLGPAVARPVDSRS